MYLTFKFSELKNIRVRMVGLDERFELFLTFKDLDCDLKWSNVGVFKNKIYLQREGFE